MPISRLVDSDRVDHRQIARLEDVERQRPPGRSSAPASGKTGTMSGMSAALRYVRCQPARTAPSWPGPVPVAMALCGAAAVKLKGRTITRTAATTACAGRQASPRSCPRPRRTGEAAPARRPRLQYGALTISRSVDRRLAVAARVEDQGEVEAGLMVGRVGGEALLRARPDRRGRRSALSRSIWARTAATAASFGLVGRHASSVWRASSLLAGGEQQRRRARRRACGFPGSLCSTAE